MKKPVAGVVGDHGAGESGARQQGELIHVRTAPLEYNAVPVRVVDVLLRSDDGRMPACPMHRVTLSIFQGVLE